MHFLTKLLEPKANGAEIAILLTALLNVKVSDSTLTREIEQHPDNPSLLSLSDVLNTYGVANIGVKFDNSKFTEIPMPFVTQLKGAKSSINFLTIVKEIKGEIIYFFDPEKHNWSMLNKVDFLKRCSGVALLIEVEEYAGEKDYIKSWKKEKERIAKQTLIASCIPTITLVAGIMTLIHYGKVALLPFAFSVLTLAGAIATVLLLLYELDQHNPVLLQICSASKKVNCGAVLQSKAAKIAGISWSAIGFSYFTGQLLLLLSWGLTNRAFLFVISWTIVIAMPYLVFSVYYQWRIVKQWCVLCLIVGSMLMLQFTITLFGSWQTLLPVRAIGTDWIISALTAFIIPLLTTTLLMPALQKAKLSRRIASDLQKLKHNRQIFEALLPKQKQVIENPDGLGISIGNPNSTFKLIKVCNPYCEPCARAHKSMEELLHNNPDLRVQIIFTATNNEGDPTTLPVKRLLALVEKNEHDMIKQALDDWYLPETKDYEVFAAKYPFNGELKHQEAKIENMKNWCEKTGITFTPTFFVSVPSDDRLERYYQLPEMYSVTDLKYLFSA